LDAHYSLFDAQGQSVERRSFAGMGPGSRNIWADYRLQKLVIKLLECTKYQDSSDDDVDETSNGVDEP
jgi:hypothetical protein